MTVYKIYQRTATSRIVSKMSLLELQMTKFSTIEFKQDFLH